MFAHSVKGTSTVVTEVKAALKRVPVFPKLSPNVTSLLEIADAAIEAGADGLSLVNTVFGMSIDVRTRRPKLAGTIGGLSGPAIHPVAVRAVHEVHRAFPHVPLIGQGGITDTDSALQLIMAGASAVAVGTANFVNPRTSLELVDGLSQFGNEQGIASIGELVGAVKLEG